MIRLFILISTLFFSCQDNCDYYRTYTAYDPIYSKIEDIFNWKLYEAEMK